MCCFWSGKMKGFGAPTFIGLLGTDFHRLVSDDRRSRSMDPIYFQRQPFFSIFAVRRIWLECLWSDEDIAARRHASHAERSERKPHSMLWGGVRRGPDPSCTSPCAFGPLDAFIWLLETWLEKGYAVESAGRRLVWIEMTFGCENSNASYIYIYICFSSVFTYQ